MPGNQSVYERAIINETILWWRQHRPVHWNQDKHLENPTVNVLPEHYGLAKSVAAYVRDKKERNLRADIRRKLADARQHRTL